MTMTIEYLFNRVIDGLSAISAEPYIQKEINEGKGDLDDIFDFEPLDWLKELKQNAQIPNSLYTDIMKLYEDIGAYTFSLSWKQEDELISSEEPPMSCWRLKARQLCNELKEVQAKGVS